MNKVFFLAMAGSVFFTPISFAQSSQEDVLRAQASELEIHHAELKDRKVALENVQAIEEELTILKRELDSAMAEMVAQMEALEKEKENFEKRKREDVLVIRRDAIGEKFEKLKTVSGKIYQLAEIKKISDIGMEIRHSSGSSRIPADELPEVLRERFQFNAEDAMKLKELEMKSQLRYAKSLMEAKTATNRSQSQKASLEPNEDSEIKVRNSNAATINAGGALSARVIATGRARIAARPEDLRTCVYVNITQQEITVGFSSYDARTYKEKFDHLRMLDITASANVDANIYLNGSKIGEVKGGKTARVRTVAAGRSGYEAKLVSNKGETLDIETNLKKTGL